jgi:NAD(P)-dependent dehydrogenase (short-subunit alcohol dehydrogenase family)
MAEARCVVVTGASRGLGLTTAAHLYGHGWTVVAAVRSPADALTRLRALTGATTDDARLTALPLDLMDPESIDACAASILATVGTPHGVVHNAGVAALIIDHQVQFEAKIPPHGAFAPCRIAVEDFVASDALVMTHCQRRRIDKGDAGAAAFAGMEVIA